MGSKPNFTSHRPPKSLADKTVRSMATDKGLWSPVNVFRACREAAGQPHFAIDHTKAKERLPVV